MMNDLTFAEYIFLSFIMTWPLWVAIAISLSGFAIYETWSNRKESKIAYLQSKLDLEVREVQQKKRYIMALYNERERRRWADEMDNRIY